MDKRAKLQSIEGTLKNLCLQLGVVEAAHTHVDNQKRRQKLLKLAIKALRELDEGGAALSMEEPSLGGGLDAAADALSRRMGWTPGVPQ